MKEPEKYLSSIQVWITVIWIISWMFGGLALSDDLTIFLEQFTILWKYANDIAIIIILWLITYFSIVIWELFPKSVWLRNPEKIILNIIPIVNVFTKIFYPIVLLLSFSTNILLKVFQLNQESEKPEDPIREIILLTKLAVNNNRLSKHQADMLFNSINIDKLSVEKIMTKKDDINCLRTSMSMEEIIVHTQNSLHTRYPLLENEDIIWYIHVKDLYYTSKHPNVSIKDLARKILFFKDSDRVIAIFPQLLKRSQHMAMVKDADNNVVGMITLENILESIVWDINDEYDMV